MDLAIVQWVAETLHTPFLDRVMPVITAICDHGEIWIISCLLLLCFRRTRRYGVMMGIALFLSLVCTNLLLKNIVARARPFTHLPELTLLISPPDDWSFPSGHSSISFAGAFVVWFWNKRWGAAALVLALLIVLSRLYLSVHYPTDLLAGVAIGTMCAFSARWLMTRYGSKLPYLD